MKIVVCIKAVPDTETRVKPAADGLSVSLDGVSFITGPYDEFAIEEALKIKEKTGAGEVVLVSVGGAECEKVLRDGLALGADKVVWVKEEAGPLTDPLFVAKILAAAVQKESADIALFGKQGVGQDNHQVPALVAELLGWPCASVAVGVESAGDKLVVRKEIDGGEEIVEVKVPAVVSAQKGLNSPRYPSMKGKLASKKMPVNACTAAELGVAPVNPSWIVEKVELPPARPSGRVLPGEPEQQVSDLVKLLREEARVL